MESEKEIFLQEKSERILEEIPKDEETMTITFGEVCENHVSMQKVGEKAREGFSKEDLDCAKIYFETRGYECELIAIHESLPQVFLKDFEARDQEAWLLLVRRGLEAWVDVESLKREHRGLRWDTKAKMRGRVVNKRARHNLCYAEKSQEPHYEEGKGRIVAFEDVPLLKTIREKIPEALGEKARDLFAEGNLYYDITKCGIGFHGDGERKKVVAFRLGACMPLHYQWFWRSKPIGERMVRILQEGDLYVMSEKATGYDWKRRVIPTLRHAAGAKKFLKIRTI